MRRYEGVVITDPDISEEQRDQVFARVQDLVPQNGGMFVDHEDWGVRKLAYTIRKKTRGHYMRLDFCGHGALVDEMERFYRIDDRVLKYMTVLLEKDVDMEKLQEEIAAKKAKKEAEKAATEAQADAEAETVTDSDPSSEPDKQTEEQ